MSPHARAWVLLAALPWALAQAQVYRWVDAQGRVQLGDRPPPGVQAEAVVPRAQSHKPVDAAAERARATEQQERWQRALKPPLQENLGVAPARNRRAPAPAADACAQARNRYQGARDGSLAYCQRSTGHCERVDAADLALLEREMTEACSRR